MSRSGVPAPGTRDAAGTVPERDGRAGGVGSTCPPDYGCVVVPVVVCGCAAAVDVVACVFGPFLQSAVV